MQDNPLDALLRSKEELKIVRESLVDISLEEGFIKSVTDKISSSFSDSKETLTNNKNSLVEFLEGIGSISLIKDIRKINNNSEKLSKNVVYRLIDGHQIPTIVGLQTRLIFPVNLVNIELTHVVKNYAKTIDAIDTRLAKFIGDPEVRKSFKKPTKNIDSILNFNTSVKSSLNDMFNLNDIEDMKPLNKLIGNNSEYVTILSTINDTNDTIDDKFIIAVKKDVTVLSERLDIIYTIIKSKELLVTKETLSGLIDAVDAASNYISTISGLYYLHIQSSEVMLTVEKIYKKYENKK